MLQISQGRSHSAWPVRSAEFVALITGAASLSVWIIDRRWQPTADIIALLLVSAGALTALRTVRRRANVASILKETDRLLRGIMQVSVDGEIALSAIRDGDGRIIDFRFLLANPAAQHLLERTWTQLNAKTFRAGLPSDLADSFFPAFVEVVESGSANEFQVDRGHGKTKSCLRTVAVKFDDGVAVTIEDVSRRCQADEALGKATAGVNELMRSVPLAMMSIDSAALVTTWNPSAERLFGWSAAEVVGKRVPFLNPQEAATFDDRVAGVIAGRPIQGQIVRRVCKNGKSVDLAVSVAPLVREDGTIHGCLAVYDDITERKALEDTVRFSEARLKLALDVSNVGMWDWRLQTNELFFSDSWLAMLGYREGELATTLDTFRALAHPDDLPEMFKQWDEHASGHRPVFACELRMAHKDGRWLWIRTSGRIIEHDVEGIPLRALGTHTDVTDYRRSEAELRASTDRLRAVLDAIPLAAIVYTFDRKALNWNPAAQRLFGWTSAEVVGNDLRIIPNELVDDWQRNIRDRVGAGETVMAYRTRRVRPRRHDNRCHSFRRSAA